MNQFFSFDRFSLLVSKHWADNKKRYLLSVLAFAGLLITWFAFTLVIEDDSDRMSLDVQLPTYFFFLFIAGTLYTSQYYSELEKSNVKNICQRSFFKACIICIYTVCNGNHGKIYYVKHHRKNNKKENYRV